MPTVKHGYHEPTVCDRVQTQYVGRGHKGFFRCPYTLYNGEPCGRTTWQHLNFLGRKKVYCIGTKFVKSVPELLGVK
jgi:hypothetical protein